MREPGNEQLRGHVVDPHLHSSCHLDSGSAWPVTKSGRIWGPSSITLNLLDKIQHLVPHLEGTDLNEVHLEALDLSLVHFEGATLVKTRLQAIS